jgi:hypothetical protein
MKASLDSTPPDSPRLDEQDKNGSGRVSTPVSVKCEFPPGVEQQALEQQQQAAAGVAPGATGLQAAGALGGKLKGTCINTGTPCTRDTMR